MTGGAPGDAGAHFSARSAPDASPAPDDALVRFDRRADALFARVRGDRSIDLAAATVSNLADYGFVWAVLAAVKGRRPGPARRRAVSALAAAGVASAGLNAGVKAAVRRERPAPDGRPSRDGPIPVRRPTSTSFPSGHTLAAFCTAVVLADGPAETAGFVAFAAAVALSRVHLGDHHASDVLAGALLGLGAGAAGRWLLGAVR